LNNNSTDTNNINGVANVIQNKKNNNLVNNSIDNSNISGVDNIIQNEENNNLDKYNTDNNNISGVDIVTPGVQESEVRQSVDLDPPISRMDNSDLTENEALTGITGIVTATPILRLRGGIIIIII
jgi:hypothetical protein